MLQVNLNQYFGFHFSGKKAFYQITKVEKLLPISEKSRSVAAVKVSKASKTTIFTRIFCKSSLFYQGYLEIHIHKVSHLYEILLLTMEF
jgi:hypothetical protein